MLSMKNEIEKIWDDVLVKLEQEHDVSSAAINAWIKPLHIKDVQSNKIILSLDAKYDERGIQFIKKKMYDFYISLAISDLTGKKYDIEFELEKEGEKPQETGANKKNWTVGDKVTHKAWGIGTVVKVNGTGEDMELDIAFPEKGIKRLLAAFAPITKVEK